MNLKFLSKKSCKFYVGAFFICYSMDMQASNFTLPAQQEKMNNFKRIVNQSINYVDGKSLSFSADDYRDQAVKISDALGKTDYQETCTSSCVATIVKSVSNCLPKTAAQLHYNYILLVAQNSIAKHKASDCGFTGYLPLQDRDNEIL